MWMICIWAESCFIYLLFNTWNISNRCFSIMLPAPLSVCCECRALRRQLKLHCYRIQLIFYGNVMQAVENVLLLLILQLFDGLDSFEWLQLRVSCCLNKDELVRWTVCVKWWRVLSKYGNTWYIRYGYLICFSVSIKRQMYSVKRELCLSFKKLESILALCNIRVALSLSSVSMSLLIRYAY